MLRETTSLSVQDREQLGKLLDNYRQAIDRGESFSIDEACEDFPQLAPYLREQVRGRHGDDALLRVTAAPAESTTPSEVVPRGEIPDRIGDYRVLNVIAVHGQGIVYRADHPHLNRQVVIKASKNALSAAAQTSLLKEGRTLAKLSHTNLAQVYDLQFHDGRPFLVMEYIEGRNLAELLHDTIFQIKDVIDLIRTLAKAIHHAHGFGVTHRDLKPANVMIRAVDRLPKIIDFGLAESRTVYGESPLGASLGGTIAYMAPEQAEAMANGFQGPDRSDERVDIFGLGAILYEMLTGKTLYRYTNQVSGLRLAINCGFDHSALEKPDIPESLRLVCLKALAKASCDRYRTAAELADALELCRQSDAAISTGKSDSDAVPAVPKIEPEVSAEAVAVFTVSRPKRSSRFWKQTTVAAFLSSLLGLAWFFSAASVFRIVTPEGTLVVKVSGEDFATFVRGKQVTVTNTATEESYTIDLDSTREQKLLKPGEYFLVESNAGLHTETKRFTIRSGKESIVEVFWEETEADLSRDASEPLPARISDFPGPAISPFSAIQAQEHQRRWADFLQVPLEIEMPLAAGHAVTMVFIPPGEFLMGSDPEEVLAILNESKEPESILKNVVSEKPRHRVKISSPFYLGKFEVTQGQYSAVIGSNPSENRESLSHPVEQVSWNDAVSFADRMTEIHPASGLQFTLPTEAQWEYACRAGTSTPYHFAASPSALAEYGWFWNNSSKQSHPVGQLRPNHFGLHDMHGNVWEWCEDWFSADYYKSSPLIDPVGPAEPVDGAFRVQKGGFYGNADMRCRSAHRHPQNPDAKWGSLGFRVAAKITAFDTVKTKRSETAKTGGLEKQADPIGPLKIGNKVESGVASASAKSTAENKAVDDHPMRALQTAWAKRLGLDVEFANSLQMRLRVIPPGEFTMGNTAQQTSAIVDDLKGQVHPNFFENFRQAVLSAQTQHQVILTKPFAIGKYEVTRGQFRRFVEATDYQTEYPGEWESDLIGNTKLTDDHPISSVTWNDAVAFCEWLSLKEDELYRLPTEAEWEFACWAGSPQVYPPKQLLSKGWYVANSGTGPRPIGQKDENELGLHDMIGNVAEWCHDALTPYPAELVINPRGSNPQDAWIRVLRGGSFQDPAAIIGAAGRQWSGMTGRAKYLGFRIVKEFQDEDTIRGDRDYFTAIESLGGEVDFYGDESIMTPFVQAAAVNHSGTLYSLERPQELGVLPKLMAHSLVYLNLRCADFDDESLKRLTAILRRRPSHFPAINLRFYGTAISSEALAHLVDLSINGLEIDDTPLNSAGLEAIRDISAFDSLFLNNCELDDSALARVLRGTKVRWLSVGRNRLTGAGLKVVEASQVSMLFIAECGLDDEQLTAINQIKGLTNLNLSSNPITDEGIDRLRDLTTLQSLSLYHTGVTEAGVNRLHERIPGCQILWNGGVIDPAATSSDTPESPAITEPGTDQADQIDQADQTSETPPTTDIDTVPR